MSQYFENDASVRSDIRRVSCWCKDKKLEFDTDPGVFSYNQVDDASMKLLRFVNLETENVLDLGCGYGLIGIFLKTKYPEISLTQSDVNERALELCRTNCLRNSIVSRIICSDGFERIEQIFDCIILNPPIHAGKEICLRLMRDALSHLNHGGMLYLVIRKKHGALSYIKDLEQIGIVSILDKKDGIIVFRVSPYVNSE